MASLTRTETLDNLYTTTWYHTRDSVADNVFDMYPLFFWMRDKGKLRPVEGGRFIEDPIAFDENTNITWIKKGGTVSLGDYEFLTVAHWDWFYLVAPLVRFGVDDQQNRGRMAILNLLQQKINNTRIGLAKELETVLFAGAASGDEFDGLQRLVADNPAASVDIAGIDQNVNSWWRNKFTDMTTESFAAFGFNRMRTILNNVSNNGNAARPDIIVSGQNPYEYYEDSILDFYRINSNLLGDAGFQNIMFKGIPMVWSPSCGTRMYFLNTEHLSMVYDPDMFFDMTEWKAIPDQVRDRAEQIIFATSFTTNRRRAHGVIFNIDTE